MLTASKLIPAGKGLAAVLLRRSASIVLDWDLRQKSRFEATDSSGRQVAVFLPRGSVVRGGDVLLAEDGSLIRVLAAPQPVMVIRPCAQHGSPFDLLRAAYHLGNRHVSIELQPDHLKIEPDPVLAQMLDRMHLIVNEALAPFEPEGGAYQAGAHAAGHGHSHDHHDAHEHAHGGAQPEGHEHARQDPAHESGHSHDHSHDHAHDHAHPHGPHAHGHTHAHDAGSTAAKAAVPGHVHGPGCGHEH
jgi:urease accessory protein